MAREEQRNARAFGMILVNSLFSRESVRRAYGLDARVCYLGVDTRLFRPLDRERAPAVVSVGALVPSERPKIHRGSGGLYARAEAEAGLVGNASLPGYRDEVVRLAAKLHVDLQIEMGVSDDKLVETLNGASVFAYAASLEPFGYAPLEANACGLPVVAVAEGGVRETVIDGENGVLVEHEPSAMAEAIARLLADPACAQEMGRRARQITVERWRFRR